MSSVTAPRLFTPEGSLTPPFQEFCQTVAQSATRDKMINWAKQYLLHPKHTPDITLPLVELFKKLDLLETSAFSVSDLQGVVILDGQYVHIQSCCTYLQHHEQTLKCNRVLFLISTAGERGDREFVWDIPLVWRMHRYEHLQAQFIPMNTKGHPLQQWLATSPEKGRYLVIADVATTILCQKALRRRLPDGYSFDFKITEPMDNHCVPTLLHSLAKMILNETNPQRSPSPKL